MSERFIESSLNHSTTALRQRLDEYGYLFIRECLDRRSIRTLEDKVLSILSGAGWLDGAPRLRTPKAAFRLTDRDDAYQQVLARLYRIEEMHAFVRAPAVRRVMAALLGTDDLLLHPNIVPRVIPPSHTTSGENLPNQHQDYTAFQGSPRALTCWAPLHNCALQDGTVSVAVRSHVDGIYPFGPSPNGGIEVQFPPSTEWHQGDFSSGDLLIFWATTLHKTLRNKGGHLRLSLDFRYQSASEAACEPYFCDHAVVVRELWTNICRDFSDPALLNSILTPPRNVCDYDLSFLRRREQLALHHGRMGDRRILRELENMRSRGTSPAVRLDADALIRALQTSEETAELHK